MKALVAIGLTMLLAAAANAAPAKRPANPSFRVDVSATLVRRNVRHIVGKPQSNGCVVRTDADATSLMRLHVETPRVLTYRQLLHGVSPFAALAGKETRGGSYRYGYDTTSGCPHSGETIREGDTSTCGTKHFKVLELFDTVGFVNRTHRFRFSVRNSAPDPFGGGCLSEIFTGDNDVVPNSVSIFLPPDPWKAAGPPYWQVVDPRTLLQRKQVVISFTSTRTIPVADVVKNPDAFTQATITNQYTLAWTVTLTPRD